MDVFITGWNQFGKTRAFQIEERGCVVLAIYRCLCWSALAQSFQVWFRMEEFHVHWLTLWHHHGHFCSCPLCLWEQLWRVEIGLIFIFVDKIERTLSWSKIQLPCPPSLLYNKSKNGWKRLNFTRIQEGRAFRCMNISPFGSHQLTSGNTPELDCCFWAGFKDNKDKNLPFWMCPFRAHGYTNWQCSLWGWLNEFVPLQLEKLWPFSSSITDNSEMPLKCMSGRIPRLTVLLLLRSFNYIMTFINILFEVQNFVHSLN